MLLELQTDRLQLRIPELNDADKIVRYYERNRLRFANSRALYCENFFTESHWLTQIAKMQNDFQQQISACLYLLHRESPAEIIGNINLTNVVRGAFHSCFLGYSLDKDYEGHGYMSEGLQAAIEYAFANMNLHRISANYRPENSRSEKLLQRLGFQKEGFAKDYLFLNGQWCDHVLTSLINHKWKAELTKP